MLHTIIAVIGTLWVVMFGLWFAVLCLSELVTLVGVLFGHKP